MIPVLFPSNATVYTTNGLGRLSDCTAAVIHEQRNGVDELEIEMPATGLHFGDIGLDSIIVAKPSPNRAAQPFSVYSIEKSMDGMMATIQAEHVGYKQNLIPVLPFTATSANAALQGLISNAAETNPFTYWTDVTRAGTYTQKEPSSVRARLQGEQGSILQTYGGEIEFDNWAVKLWANRGIDRGTEIRYGKNLMSLEQDQSIQNTITGILPYWSGKVGETDTVYWLPEVVLYSSHASDFAHARTVCVDFSQDFQEKPTAAQLRAAGNKYITDNGIGVPEVGFDVNFATLAQTTDYKDIALLERIDLCDFVTVIFPEFGISAKAKVVETYFDVLAERYNKIRIGDQRFTLSKTIAQQSQDIKDSEAKTETFFTQALEQATAVINGDISGSRMFTLKDADGNPQGLVFMDTADPATAVNCIRINTNGIGFSNNGVNGPYTSTWDITNTLNMANINVVGLSASYITSGTIDASQIAVINLDASNITSGTIDASHLNIGDINADWITTGIIQDATGNNYWNLDTGEISIQATAVDVGIGARNYIRHSNTLDFDDYYFFFSFNFNDQQALLNGENMEVTIT